MYCQVSWLDTHSAISSPESGDGATPCDSPDGPTTGPCGPDPALANLSARQAKERGLMTNGTFGPPSGGLSISAALQRSLESRLRASLGVNGSPEYVLTWKQWGMPSGPPICALRASARRTSDSGRGGWPTPVANDDNKSVRAHLAMNARMGGGRTAMLPGVAQAAGWATPTARDWRSESATAEHDAKRDAHPRGKPLSYQATGTRTSGFPAQTEKRGALNPELSRWLMGYSDAWLMCATSKFMRGRR